ncbi:hypothetical protein, partial [Enterococcus durans]|uniref:hypothetical protein n=1 Tax=Enterococcus durans TaxID=53345 RepID=UPI00195ABB92
AIFVHFFLFLGVKHFCPSLSQINGVQKSVFSEISKKNEQYKKRIVRFFLQFLKPEQLLSQLLLIY